MFNHSNSFEHLLHLPLETKTGLHNMNLVSRHDATLRQNINLIVAFHLLLCVK